MPRFRAPGSSVIAEVKRRSPSKGDAGRHPRPGGAGRGVRPGWCRRDQRADRGAPLRRQPGRPARGARRRRHPAAAQGLHRRALPGARGPRRGRRPGAADRGRARPTTRLRRAARPGPRAGADRCWSRCTTRPRPSGPSTLGRRAGRGQRPQPQDPRGRPGDAFGRLAPLVPADRVLVAESGITGPTDVARFVAEGARVVLVGEALVRDGDPEGAVRAMTGQRRRRDG